MIEPKDPKTLEAIDKIRAVLTEYDLWGSFAVGSTTRMHWLYHVDPSWSCLSFDPKTGEARIRAKRADFNTKEGHKYVLDLTIGAIYSTRDYAAMTFDHMDKMARLLEKQFDIEHHPFTDVEYRKPSS